MHWVEGAFVFMNATFLIDCYYTWYVRMVFFTQVHFIFSLCLRGPCGSHVVTLSLNFLVWPMGPLSIDGLIYWRKENQFKRNPPWITKRLSLHGVSTRQGKTLENVRRTIFWPHALMLRVSYLDKSVACLVCCLPVYLMPLICLRFYYVGLGLSNKPVQLCVA